MDACGCDTLQIGSTDIPIEKLDKRELVDMLG